MKYILIGGSGFIGQHFKKKLGKKILLNLDLDSGINDSKYNYCDILNDNQIQKFNKNYFEDITLIHLAAVHFDFQKNYFETNVNGTNNVLQLVSNNDCIKNYVFFSSVATYGDSEFGKNEDSLQNPTNDYGKSKLEAEMNIKKWHKKNSNKKVIIVRPAVVYGEFNFGNVFNLLQQIKSGFFAIIGKGKNIKSIAYAENVVDSVMFCLSSIKENLFIYNYCDYPQMTISQQSLLLSSLCNKNKPFKIPLILTKLLTIPIDILEKIFRRDLKINSMRVKKFTVSTFFEADKIRKRGFKQNVSTKKAMIKTKNWIEKSDIYTLRNTWYKKASKL